MATGASESKICHRGSVTHISIALHHHPGFCIQHAQTWFLYYAIFLIKSIYSFINADKATFEQQKHKWELGTSNIIGWPLAAHIFTLKSLVFLLENTNFWATRASPRNTWGLLGNLRSLAARGRQRICNGCFQTLLLKPCTQNRQVALLAALKILLSDRKRVDMVMWL